MMSKTQLFIFPQLRINVVKLNEPNALLMQMQILT